jgi:O-antigen/teichoic acid export membrane protein
VASRTLKAGILVFGQGITALSAILIGAYLSRELSKADYATYRQTLLSYRFVAPVLMLGLPQALLYFLPQHEEQKRKVLFKITSTLFVVGCVFSLLIFFGGNHLLAKRFNNPDLAGALKLFAPYAAMMLPVSLLTNCLVACGKVKIVAIYNIVSSAALLVILFVWMTMNSSYEGAIKANLVHALLIFVPAILVMWAISGKPADDKEPVKLKEILKYSLPLGVGLMVGQFNLNLDKVIVAAMTTPEDFAVYVNGAMEVPLIGMITGAASAVILPDMVKACKEGNKMEALELWKRAAVKSALIIFPAAAFLMVMAPELMTFIYSDAYVESSLPFRIYLCILPLRIMFFGVLFQAVNRSSLVLQRALINVIVNGVLTIIFIWLFGAWGAAVGTVTAIILFVYPYCIWHARRELKVRTADLFSMRGLGQVFVCAALAAVPVIIILRSMGELSAVWSLCLSAIVYGLGYILVGQISGFVKLSNIMAVLQQIKRT